MTNVTIAEYLANIPTVATSILGLVGQVLELFTSQPILVVFVACAFVGLAIKYGRRLLNAAKKAATA